MTDTIALLVMSVVCAVIGGALGVAAVHRRAHAAARGPRADRE